MVTHTDPVERLRSIRNRCLALSAAAFAGAALELMEVPLVAVAMLGAAATLFLGWAVAFDGEARDKEIRLPPK